MFKINEDFRKFVETEDAAFDEISDEDILSFHSQIKSLRGFSVEETWWIMALNGILRKALNPPLSFQTH